MIRDRRELLNSAYTTSVTLPINSTAFYKSSYNHTSQLLIENRKLFIPQLCHRVTTDLTMSKYHHDVSYGNTKII